MNLQEFEALLREIFPIGDEPARLELVSLALREGKEPTLVFTVRLICFQDGQISNIKEQDIFAGPAEMLEWDQLEMYYRGYGQALTEILQKAPPNKTDEWMPIDLFPRPFVLKRATTSDEYRKAFLLKSRLGKLLL